MAMDEGAVGYAKMQSLFAAAMLLGAPSGIAYALQGNFSTSGSDDRYRLGKLGRRFDLLLGTLVLAGAPLATPFVLDYDLTLLAFPLIWLAAQDFRPWRSWFSSPLSLPPPSLGRWP